MQTVPAGFVRNLDVIHNIMSFSDLTSTSRLMRTCRTLSHEGAKHILRDTPFISSEATAISFTQYAFARADVDEMAHRMHWLRSLHLCAPRLPGSRQKFCRTMAFFFSRFAIRAPSFVELRLFSSEDLSSEAAFAEGIDTIVSLQKLILIDAGRQSLKMLHHSKLRLWFAEIWAVDAAAEPSANPHPLLALHNSQDTLRVLSLDNVAFDADRLLPCYRNLIQLELATSLVPPIHRLAQAFPNLRMLGVKTYPGYSHLETAEREQRRQASMFGQARHGTFRALRSYTGTILSLYLFALTCRIPFLELRDDDDEPCWDMRMLQTVCTQTRPTHLELYISYLHDWPSQADGFVQLCANDLRTTRTLTLNFDIVWGVKDIDLGPVLECVYLAVRGSPVRAVELILDWRHFWEDCFEEEESNLGTPPPAEVFLRSLNVDAVADKLFETTDSLKTVIVCLKSFEAPDVRAQRGPDIDYSDDK